MNSSAAHDPYRLTPFKETFSAAMQWFYRRLMKIYLREVVVLETSNSEGVAYTVRKPSLRKHLPTLLVANHPNGLIDPLVIYATARTTLRVIAKSTLWNEALLRPFLNMAGAVPVQRPRDAEEISKNQHESGSKIKNTQEFIDIVSRAMCRHSFVIFPEGLSHENPEVQPLKTGAARMLLSAAAYVTKNPDKNNFGIYRPQDLSFQAVGLYFDDNRTFRSRGLVHYGKRLYLDDIFTPEVLQQIAVDPLNSEYVRKLTAAMETTIKVLLPEAPDFETREITRRIASLLFEENRRTKISDVYRVELVVKNILEKFRDLPQDEVQKVRANIDRYFNELNYYGFRDSLVRDLNLAKEKFIGRQRRIQAWFWLRAALFLPLSLLGIVLYYLPYRLTGKIAFNLAEDPVEFSTYKLLSGMVLIAVFDLLYTVATVTFTISQGRIGWQLLLAALLPTASAMAALMFTDKLKIRLGGLRVLLSSKVRKQIYDIGERREALVDQLLSYLKVS